MRGTSPEYLPDDFKMHVRVPKQLDNGENVASLTAASIEVLQVVTILSLVVASTS